MPEEPCQCPDCQRFYREHDRLIREFPTLRQQQELNWAALQSFRTLSGRVLELFPFSLINPMIYNFLLFIETNFPIADSYESNNCFATSIPITVTVSYTHLRAHETP